MNDFLALIEEKSDSRTGSPVYIISRNHAVPDDFAQAVNIGCLALWQTTSMWPSFGWHQPDASQIQYSYDEDLDWDVTV